MTLKMKVSNYYLMYKIEARDPLEEVLHLKE